ncbi:MAG: matrixin family metalloprotease [Pseudomonadales bacterium]|nr:matrixin family metalloprotease [Pseudomonadales bacterium]
MLKPPHSAGSTRIAFITNFAKIIPPYCLRRFAVLIALLALCNWPQESGAASWQQAPEVVYLDTGSPLSAQEVEAAIEYAIASWSARIELQMHYSRLAADRGFQAGKIVIRWVDTLEMIRNGSDILSQGASKRWVYPSTGAIAGVEIFLHREAFRQRRSDSCFRHTVLHELGHALGIGHLPEKTSVMYASLGACQHTLSTEDIAAAPYPHKICHAELLANKDIYVPLININAQSFAGRLRYMDGFWSVTELRKVSNHPECNDSYLAAGNLILNKVWTQDQLWKVELSPVGNGDWILDLAF